MYGRGVEGNHCTGRCARGSPDQRVPAHLDRGDPHLAEPSASVSGAGGRDGFFLCLGQRGHSHHLPRHGHGVQIASSRELCFFRAATYDFQPGSCGGPSGNRLGEGVGAVRTGLRAI